MSVKSICGVILAARKPKELADFYARVLDVEFEREDHGDLLIHYGVDIGQTHFGIHPAENMKKSQVGNASVSIAFNVTSLAKAVERLDALGAQQLAAPHDEGFGMVAMYADPEGNHFEVVELNYSFE